MSESILLEFNDDGNLDTPFTDGTITLCTDAEACAVQIVENLMLVREEAIANPLVNTRVDPQAGMDWYGTVLNDSQDRVVGELEMKRIILGTKGVLYITEWAPVYPTQSAPGHTLTLSARVMTIWGEISLNQALGL